MKHKKVRQPLIYSEKSEFTNSMIEVIEKNATEKKRRQGQKKADGTTAKAKPVCPKCGEICVRSYTRGNEERKRAYIGSGWACPSKTCDYIIKDLVQLEDTEEAQP